MDYKELYNMSQDLDFYASKLTINKPDGIVPFKLNSCQQNIIKELENNSLLNVYTPRQVGGSILIAFLASHYAIFNANKNIAVITINIDSAKTLKNLCENFISQLPLPITYIVNNMDRIELSNGTKIIFSSINSSSKFRGRGYQRVFLDNIAFAKDNSFYDFYCSVFPTITSSEQTKVLSINSGIFNDTEYKKYWLKNLYIPASQVNDKYYQEAISKIKNIISEDRFKHEYEGEIVV